MIKEIFVTIGLCCLIRDTYAQHSNKSPFNTIGGKQEIGIKMTMLEQADIVTSDSVNEPETMDIEPDRSTGNMPLLVSLPLKDIHVNSPFGRRRDPMNRTKNGMHNGLDLKARFEDVYSMLPGTVTATGNSISGGNYIAIDYGVCTCSYFHLSKISVERGQYVNAGQKIAVSGNTGSRSTGPHLHISCQWNDTGKYFDPRILLKFITDELLKWQIRRKK